ncbi:MAG: NAD-dependent epimerase/dehydratase family protein [Chloroflexota bacterium]
MTKKCFALFGGTGAIGTHLTQVALQLGHMVVSYQRKRELPSELQNHPNVRVVRGVDITDAQGVAEALAIHQGSIDVLWNLAAPLSVETQNDPAHAEQVTVGGMRNILNALATTPRKPVVCFSDSVGSYGATAPRQSADVQWLIDNPTQDPGSNYGIQKRAIRDLLAEATEIDTRFLVIPGVLHASPTWGAGTTEYVLDAIKEVVETGSFECPIPANSALPMIHLDDLVDAMIRLSVAETVAVTQGGFTLQGFSFTPAQLKDELCRQLGEDGVEWVYGSELTDANKSPALAKAARTQRQTMTQFATIWPESLEVETIAHELGWRAKRDFADTIAEIVAARKLTLLTSN